MEPLDQNHEATESQEELSLGSLLKKSRNERGIELEEAFRETRIRRQILEALENERWDELSPSTFVKGFLKTYADFLGLDKNTVLELYERSIPIEKGKSESLTQESLGTNRRPLILIVSAVALAFIVSITFLSRKDISIVDKFYQYMGTQEPVAEKKQAPVPEQTKTRDIPDKKEIPSKTMAEEQDLVPEQMETWDAPDEVEIPSKTMAEEQDLVPEQMETLDTVDEQEPGSESMEEIGGEQDLFEYEEPAETTAITGSAHREQLTQEEEPVSPQFTLTAKVTKRTWIAIYVDDQPVKEYLFQPGETFSWQADQGFDILVGNAGGIDLILNGEEIGPLGAEGKVVRVKLPESEE